MTLFRLQTEEMAIPVLCGTKSVQERNILAILGVVQVADVKRQFLRFNVSIPISHMSILK